MQNKLQLTLGDDKYSSQLSISTFIPIKFLITIMLAVSLTGCMTAPPKVDYVAFDNALNNKNSQIIGSTVDIDYYSYDDWTTTVVTIDGKEITTEKNLLSKVLHTPIEVTPGVHSVEITMWQGQLGGYAEFELNFEKGTTYIAKAHADDDKYMYLWIENFKTGQAVTQRIRVRRQALGTFILFL